MNPADGPPTVDLMTGTSEGRHEPVEYLVVLGRKR